MKESSLIYNHGSSKSNQLIKEPALRTIISLSFDENHQFFEGFQNTTISSYLFLEIFPPQKKKTWKRTRGFL
jgi:hypothetical protein